MLVVALLLAFSVALMGCGKSEEESIRDSINGFVTAYNAGDYEKCVDYLEGVTDSTREGVMSTLGLAKAIVQSIQVTSIANVKVDGAAATAEVAIRVTVAAALGGNSADETVDLSLSKVDGKWKFDLKSLTDSLMGGLSSMLG